VSIFKCGTRVGMSTPLKPSFLVCKVAMRYVLCVLAFIPKYLSRTLRMFSGHRRRSPKIYTLSRRLQRSVKPHTFRADVNPRLVAIVAWKSAVPIGFCAGGVHTPLLHR
jgi:hypothetical protein